MNSGMNGWVQTYTGRAVYFGKTIIRNGVSMIDPEQIRTIKNTEKRLEI